MSEECETDGVNCDIKDLVGNDSKANNGVAGPQIGIDDTLEVDTGTDVNEESSVNMHHPPDAYHPEDIDMDLTADIRDSSIDPLDPANVVSYGSVQANRKSMQFQ